MKAAVYRHFDADGRLVYVGVSTNPYRRMQEHRSLRSYFERVVRIEIEWFDRKSEALYAERLAIRAENPELNLTHAGQSTAILNDEVDITIFKWPDPLPDKPLAFMQKELKKVMAALCDSPRFGTIASVAGEVSAASGLSSSVILKIHANDDYNPTVNTLDKLAIGLESAARKAAA